MRYSVMPSSQVASCFCFVGFCLIFNCGSEFGPCGMGHCICVGHCDMYNCPPVQ